MAENNLHAVAKAISGDVLGIGVTRGTGIGIGIRTLRTAVEYRYRYRDTTWHTAASQYAAGIRDQFNTFHADRVHGPAGRLIRNISRLSRLNPPAVTATLAALSGAVEQQEGVLAYAGTWEGQRRAENALKAWIFSVPFGSQANRFGGCPSIKPAGLENPLLVRESVDFTDCPGRESNPHDRKRSQDFKS